MLLVLQENVSIKKLSDLASFFLTFDIRSFGKCLVVMVVWRFFLSVLPSPTGNGEARDRMSYSRKCVDFRDFLLWDVFFFFFFCGLHRSWVRLRDIMMSFLVKYIRIQKRVGLGLAWTMGHGSQILFGGSNLYLIELGMWRLQEVQVRSFDMVFGVWCVMCRRASWLFFAVVEVWVQMGFVKGLVKVFPLAGASVNRHFCREVSSSIPLFPLWVIFWVFRS